MAVGYPDYIFTLWTYSKELVDINELFLIQAVWFLQNIWWIYVLVKVCSNFSKLNSILAIGNPDYLLWIIGTDVVCIKCISSQPIIWQPQE